MGEPIGLYYLLGVLMLGLAAYGVVLLLTSFLDHRSAGRDVEASHVAMGISMAGMFVPAWSFGPSAFWELIFVVLLVWFVVKSIQSIQLWGLHVPHTAIHAVMSFAMLLMYWFPSGASPRTGSMSMTTGVARIDPGVAFVTAFVLFGSALFTVASPNRGATHFGTHLGPRSRQVAASRSGRSAVQNPDGADLAGLDATIGRPALLDASHVLMAVAMGLMLILMI